MFMRFGLPGDHPPNAQDIKSCAPARPAALRREATHALLRGKKRMTSIGNVDIPQAELQLGGEWGGLEVPSRAGHPARQGFLAILKVDS